MERTDASFDNTLHCFDEQPQNTEVNVAVASDPHLNEEECDVHTGESSVDNTAQSNPNMFSETADKHFKCNICCKSFASKQNVTSHLYQHASSL